MNREQVTLNHTPIQYKELSHSDFEGYTFEDNNVTEIVSDSNGYISDFLLQNIQLDKKDTTVINASVGQGKTTAIISIAKEYYKKRDEGYIVLLIAPFKSLLDQYKNSLQKLEIPDADIFDYRELDNENDDEKDTNQETNNRPIQLMTFNFIMANAGEYYLKQNYNKTNYINKLLAFYKDNNKKVVLIFDEIHDAVDNFKQELVFNLFRWRKSTHKIIVSSATYNEASKVVIKYFAEMTDKKMKILEAPRLQYEDRLSELSILYYDKPYYDLENEELIKFFNEEIGTANKINILTYSKKLADKIVMSTIGQKIKGKYGIMNVCTGDTNNVFDDKKCNIGTNFKTGISIDEENTAYYIFLPQKKSYESSPPNLGIFTEGINTVIQALARPRKSSRIYVIMPYPTNPSIQSYNYPDNWDNREPVRNEAININKQDKLLQNFYKKTTNKLKEEIEYLESDNVLIETSFPSYDQFKLTQGEQYFRTYYDIFGKNLSNYFYWASKNNQFINCRWKYVYMMDLVIEEHNLLKGISDYANTAFELENPNSTFRFLSAYEQYNNLRNSLFSNEVIMIDEEGNRKVIKPYNNTIFEKTIIKYIQQLNNTLPYLPDYLGINYKDYIDDLIADDNALSDLEPHKKNRLLDFKICREDEYLISKEEYIRFSMHYAKNKQQLVDNISTVETDLIKVYADLYEFKAVLLTKYLINKQGNDVILPIDQDFVFEKEDYSKLESLLLELKTKDVILDKVLNFFQKGFSPKSVYSLLKKVFFSNKRVNSPEGGKVTVITGELSDPQGKINLVYRNMDLVTYVKTHQKEIKNEYLKASKEN